MIGCPQNGMNRRRKMAGGALTLSSSPPQVILRTTSEKDARMIRLILKRMANEEQWSAFVNQCNGFVANVLHAGGIDVGSFSTPRGLIEWLAKYPGAIYV